MGTEGKTEEKDAQADYEQAMSDAAKADTEAALQSHKDAHAASTKELAETVAYIHSLHAECDWLLQYFDVRKEARASEVDSLGRAKAALSGADYSLIQTTRHGRFLAP